MRKTLIPVLACLVTLPMLGAEPKTDDEKVLYAIGLVLSRNLVPLHLTPAEMAFVKDGLADGAGTKAKEDLQTWGPKINDFVKARLAASAAVEKKAGAAFLEKALAQPGAKKQPTGFVYTELKAGTGDAPKPTDRVRVNYEGKLTDGTVFDSSIARGQPAVFPLNGVIPCWTQGLQLMKVGGKAKLVCPSDLAYGDNGQPPKIMPGATLVFDVELLGIEPPAGAPMPPAPVPEKKK